MDNSLIPWYHMDGTFLFHEDVPIPTNNIFHLVEDDQTLFPDVQNPNIPPSNDSGLVFDSIPSCHVETNQAVAAAAATATATAMTGKKRKKVSKLPSESQHDDKNDQKAALEKKLRYRVLHRDMERQRRKEMADLYASLRKLLPPECLKRSIVDQLHQVANYIKHKKEEIKELELNRNKIRNSFGNKGKGVQVNNVLARRLWSKVDFTVRSCSAGGIEILINGNSSEDGNCFPLSRVLNVLRDEGLNVVNCMNTKVHENFHCRIHTEDREGASQMNDTDLCSLQSKLDKEVLAWKSLSPS
ncbi:OLC1v1031827C1 [Oldenlandia corymbosa var. corymbosa]|uniref:OLC1v1031827C1 n=1 Tax=Oldenlandia corymbosa var. corymbosa TaxID=529605 RepID=A0AAV1CKC8_OLDCO|nr:OLC1v1031827C1 [Oldenlandia corymbosa var. corymbosa]